MKVLVTGAKGQLGYDVINRLNSEGHIAVGADIDDMDITDAECVKKFISSVKPDAVIHCAAWTAVDAAEESENYEKVYAVNVIGTQNVARACADIGAKIIYISTDYVFDGNGEIPWKPEDKADPISAYGKTKYLGELAVKNATEKFFIIRIAWAFGVNGKNFVKTMLKLGASHSEVRVVNDQIGTPTYTYDLARLIVDMIETDKYGYYHATNEGGYISWYDFACEIYRQAGFKTKVIPVTTSEYGISKAARPFNSRLDKSKLVKEGFKPLPDWRDALKRYLKSL